MGEPERDQEYPRWIDAVVAAGKALGFNPVTLRWRLRRRVDRQREARRQRSQAIERLRYRHRVCPHCTAVNDRGERVCGRCGTRLRSRAHELLARAGLAFPAVTILVGAAFLAVWVRTALVGGGDSWAWMPDAVLVDHGARLPGEPLGSATRLLASLFLHHGALHALFDVVALAGVAGRFRTVHGRWLAPFVLLAGAVVAAAGGDWIGSAGVGAGASGGIAALVGATAVGGHRLGGSRGHDLRNQMVFWALFMFLFGFMAGAEVRGIAAGLVGGGLMAAPVPRGWPIDGGGSRVGAVLGLAAAVALGYGAVAALVPLAA